MNATAVQVRLPPDQLTRLDEWIAELKDPPSRPEAIRQLIDYALDELDNPEWTDEEIAKARPASEVVGPEIAKALVRKR